MGYTSITDPEVEQESCCERTQLTLLSELLTSFLTGCVVDLLVDGPLEEDLLMDGALKEDLVVDGPLKEDCFKYLREL